MVKQTSFLKKIFLSVFVYILVSCGSSSISQNPNLKTGTLSNGLTYYIYPNAYPKDFVSLRLVVRAGSLMEEDSQQGIAHFTEHMLFNGIPSFPNHSLIPFLESQGMNFGADLNAFTGYDRTVYQLDIKKGSLEDDESLKTSLKIMREWLKLAQFDQKEIDSERDIVLQEKLKRDGFPFRYSKAIYSFLGYEPFLDRLPIGKEDLIRKFKRDDFLKFYSLWYQPKRASVVIVGDNLDLQKVESFIKESFKDLTNDQNLLKIAEEKEAQILKKIHSFDIPQKPVSFEEFTDKEVKSPTLLIFNTSHPLKSLKGDRIGRTLDHEFLLEDAISSLYSRRFVDLFNRSSQPSFQYMNRYYRSSYSGASLDRESSVFPLYEIRLFSSKEKEGLSTIFYELKRLSQEGFLEEELNLYKRAELDSIDSFFDNKSKIPSSSLALNLTFYFLKDFSYSPSIEQSCQIRRDFLDQLSLKEVNKRLKKELIDMSFKILYSYSPETSKKVTQQMVEDLWKEANQSKIEGYNLKKIPSLTDHKFEKTPIYNEKYIESLDMHSWELANGTKVYFKKTNFSPNSILLSSLAKGIIGDFSAKEYIEVSVAPYLLSNSGLGNLSKSELDQFLYPFSFEISFSDSLFSNMRSIRGRFRITSPEEFFKIFYLFLAEPRVDKEAVDKYIQEVKESISNNQKDYLYPFIRKVDEALYGNNPYVFDKKDIPLDLSSERNKYFFKKNFSNLREFPLVFVGDIQVEDLKRLTSQYLGSLSTQPIKPISKKELIPLREGIYTENLYNDPEQRVTAHLSFTKNSLKLKDYKEFYIMSEALSEAYKKVLTDEVREKISGVYSIGVNCDSAGEVGGGFKTVFNISFITSPQKFPEVRQAVLNIIQRGQQVGFDEDILTYLKKYINNTYKKYYENNSYWVNYISGQIFFSEDFNHKNIEEYTKIITSEKLKEMSHLLIDFNQFKEVILNPKKV